MKIIIAPVGHIVRVTHTRTLYALDGMVWTSAETIIGAVQQGEFVVPIFQWTSPHGRTCLVGLFQRGMGMMACQAIRMAWEEIK